MNALPCLPRMRRFFVSGSRVRRPERGAVHAGPPRQPCTGRPSMDWHPLRGGSATASGAPPPRHRGGGTMNPDLTTRYLGLDLKNPLVVAACPLTGHVESLRRLADAGAAAVVLPSLFEEQLEHAQMAVYR